jgi:hypothetical protein
MRGEEARVIQDRFHRWSVAAIRQPLHDYHGLTLYTSTRATPVVSFFPRTMAV